MNKQELETKSTKTIIGTVVSVLMDKVCVVDVEQTKTHRLYGKRFVVNNKIKARNNLSDLKVGDTVSIKSVRPQSKTVHFEVVKVEK